MAFSASDSSSEGRSFSIGPLKVQVLTYSVASGDVSGTVTADRLRNAMHILLDGGLILNAAPTFSGNAVTLAFNNPAATRYGSCIVLGN